MAHNIEPRIEILTPKKLIGIQMILSKHGSQNHAAYLRAMAAERLIFPGQPGTL